MRTIIFSDVHGEPSIIAAVVEHSNYNPDTDRLIFAGDAIGIGRDSLGCLKLLDALGAECLVGNHEFMAAIGDPLECHGLADDDVARLREGIRSGRWRLATQADGLLQLDDDPDQGRELPPEGHEEGRHRDDAMP